MIKKALIAAAALLALSAHAGYAQLAPPAGFSTSNGGFTYASAANDRVYGKVIHQAGALTANVGGQSVKMPAAYRLAANAPRVAAAVVMQHPALRLAAGAAGVVAWLASAKLVYDIATGTWHEKADSSDGLTKYYKTPYTGDQEFATFQSACYTGVGSIPTTGGWSYGVKSSSNNQCVYTMSLNGYVYNEANLTITEFSRPSSGCPSGWTQTPAGCVSPALEQPEFVEKLGGKPMPETVPLELPYPTPLPVDQPWINPSPGENPQSQPLRVPTGTPVPIPNTNPQQYTQPYVDIVPAPTPDKPWQVDVKPGETTGTNPNPAENPNPDGQDKPAEEQDKSLCEKHPEIAACEKVEVTDKPLPDQPKLYEPKYPDGITGLWNSKIQEIKATPLFNLAPSLLPNVSAGSCPSWKIDLSIDGWTNAGLQDVSPPCWVWDVAKLVIIASALLLARRLIFGG